MTDTQLRGLVLQVFYARRREPWFLPTQNDIGATVSDQDILQVCDQLAQHGMLEWRVLKGHGTIRAGMGKINAFGIDVVEGEALPDIKVEFVQHTVNITGSTNVVVGNNNSQTVEHNIRELLAVVDSANASPEEKSAAKKLLHKFLEHPLVAAVAGGAIGLLG